MSRDGARAVVVGGGVIGTWHALELVRAGFTVDHLEADAAPTGASVRNFGLVWVSGRRSGEELDVARRARRRWEEIGGEVPGIGFRPMASLTVACRDEERAVMEAFARHPEATARGITFLEPREAKAANPAVAGDIAGALHCAEDAVVEPRHVPGALREHLTHSAPDRYRFHPGRRVVAAEPHTAVDATGTRWEGDLVVLATGAAYDHLPGTEAPARQLRRVRLQMLETEPLPARLTTSLADADTLRYYPAYEVAPLAELGEQTPVARQHHLQLLLVQRPGGALTVGDTHAYDEPFDFALVEDPTEELLARAERILGTPLPPVRRRWEGVYAQCRDGRVCLREEIGPGVLLVTGPGGRGMTCAPAIAADTLAAVGITNAVTPAVTTPVTDGDRAAASGTAPQPAHR
jgi:FAD dependent oxidoreductase TIGR03364